MGMPPKLGGNADPCCGNPQGMGQEAALELDDEDDEELDEEDDEDEEEEEEPDRESVR